MCKAYYAAYVKVNAPYRCGTAHWGYFDTLAIKCYMSALQSYYGIRFCLTGFILRHIYTYITEESYPDDGQKTHTTRSEDAGVKAYRHAQSTPRNRDRSPVQRKPILRFQGSSPSSLRDAEAAQLRREVDSRCGGRFRGFAAHLLSGTSSLQPIWLGGPVAQSARTKRRAQGNGRSSRLRGKFESCGTWADHCPVRASHPRAVWNLDPSAESRAGSSAGQKKTARPHVNAFLSDDAATAYEALRPYLVDLADQSRSAVGRVVLLRGGMLAWASACRKLPASQDSFHPPARSLVPSDVAVELIHLMAGLILSSGKDPGYV
jgi:hypothetical protein